ncbi:hypothetical protein ACKWTF_014731 [Chironomus riparius]
MLKRRSERSHSKTRSKIQKTSTLAQETNHNVNLPQIPVEIITNIISSLTDTNDIKNCMNLSKEVSSFIFRTPKIVHRFQFNLNCILEYNESLDFLKNKGRHIKYLKVNFDSDGMKIMKNLFSHTPNLKEFTIVNQSPMPPLPTVRRCFCCGSRQFHGVPSKQQDWMRFTKQCWMPRKGSVALPGLKVLEIELRDLDDFIRSTKYVRSLEVLVINVSTLSDQRIMNEFIMQQDNLKELTLQSIGRLGAIRFPTRNVTKDVRFRLRKLKILTNGRMIYSDMVDGFLQTQANSLEEMEFDFSLRDSNLNIIFNRFTRLKKFIQTTDAENVLIRESGVIWRTLKHVAYYEDMNVEGIRLNRVWNSFPKISSVKCKFLNSSFGDFFMIKELDVKELNILNLKNSRFLNINNLTIGKLWDCENEENWITFMMRVRNARNLTINGLQNIDDFMYIIKSLIIFTRLEKFSFRYNPRNMKTIVSDDNETIPTGCKFYKILVDKNQKTVKVSSYIVKKCKGILGILIRYFKDFEFFEFCFNVMMMKKLDVEEHKIDIREFYEAKAEAPRSERRTLRNLPAINYRESLRN